MKTKKIIVNDKMQKKYEYELVEKEGENFDKEFKPDLTPKQMLELGVFGGVYMRDCINEFPKDWFTKAKFAPKEIKKHLKELNFFKVNASQSLSVWKEKGWIHKGDPRGWFQWYCRYYMGRRLADEDKTQIRRWKAMKRHLGQIRANCRPSDVFCRPRQRQALLHWAYDSRKL
ncbi:MAG: hypothetical protein WCJ74_01905 [bacterium]